MKVTKHVPPPVEETYTLEVSAAQFRLLMLLAWSHNVMDLRRHEQRRVGDSRFNLPTKDLELQRLLSSLVDGFNSV